MTSTNMLSTNKDIVARWIKEFWGNPWNPNVVADLAAPAIVVHHPTHEPQIGRAAVAEFMASYRRAFPDLHFWPVADFVSEGDHVVARWKGGGTHAGPAYDDFRLSALTAASGRRMRFTGTSIFRIEDGRIAEELGQEDALGAMLQLGLIRPMDAAPVVTRVPLPPGWNNMPPR